MTVLTFSLNEPIGSIGVAVHANINEAVNSRPVVFRENNNNNKHSNLQTKPSSPRVQSDRLTAPHTCHGFSRASRRLSGLHVLIWTRRHFLMANFRYSPAVDTFSRGSGLSYKMLFNTLHITNAASHSFSSILSSVHRSSSVSRRDTCATLIQYHIRVYRYP